MINRILTYLFVAALALTSSMLYAQDVEFKSSNFKDDKEGFKAAEASMKKGEEFLEMGNEAASMVNDIKDYFDRALFHLEKAYAFNPNSSILNYYMGNASLYTNRKYEAKKYFDKSLKLNSSPEPMFYYHYARAQQLNLEYDKALQSIDKFYDEAKSKRAEEIKKLLGPEESE